MKTSPKFRWMLDAVLFVGFLISFFLDFTGLSLHQIIGVVGGIFAIYHLVTHWNWVSAVTNRFFGKTSDQARAYYVIDASLFGGLAIILITGLVISSWLNLPLSNYSAWRVVHIVASMYTLLVIVLKIVLHAGWIVSWARKTFTFPGSEPIKPTPTAASPGMSRRDFLKLTGIVGMASFVALNSSVHSLQTSTVSQVEEDPTVSTTSSSSSAALNSSVPQSSTSSASNGTTSCFVRCNRRCSYPGKCHRYTDSNSNGRCDFGECQA